jgi:hypothetical protein
MRRAALATLTAAAALLGVGAGLAGPAAATPFDGNGSWIWYVSQSGGSPGEVARDAKRNGLDVVFVKSSDGTDRWSQFSPELVRALHRRGVKACAWPYVYGNDPGREAKLTAQAADAGADCIAIDAEGEYEGKYRQAFTYIHKLRRLVGDDYPLALAGFPYTDYHPAFPYSVFLGAGGARYSMPQLYWHAIGDSVKDAFAHTYRWNRGYGRPIFPIGQTYEDPGRRELLDFRRYAHDYGAAGASWWSWQETSRPEWRIVGRRGVKGVKGFEPEENYAPLEQGDRGDMVLFAQELLLGAGRQPKPTAVYDARTVRAVRAFQLEQGLRVTGRLGDATWGELIRVEPLSTNWKRVRVPRTLARGAVERSLPSELPAGIGRG